MNDFVHLHVHSDYSLLDGAASIDSLVSKASENKMSHLALTDHGSMFGTVEFYNACRSQGINPIIGSEFYITDGSRHDRGQSFSNQINSKNRSFHMGLIAYNELGYKNLIQLSTLAFSEGFYYKPRIDEEILEKHISGLIGFSGCLAAKIPSLIIEGHFREAIDLAGKYQEFFGKDNFFLELQNHGIDEQRIVNEALLKIHKNTGIPLVATNDVHYPNREDAHAQDILICVGTNKKLSDKNRLRFNSQEFYFKNYNEMEELFTDVPDALSNTVLIAEKCELEIPQPGPLLPEYQVPEGHTQETYLRQLAESGMKERYRSVTPEIEKRLNYELNVIDKMGYAGYFLIVWDFISYARNCNLPVGPGRGSGAGSLTAYSLYITGIDPIKFGLLFERFLNPERVSMPDFDIDFCYERRNEVIQYVTSKYGSNRVAQIITFGSLKARAVIRDVARVLSIPYGEADAIAKMVPSGPKSSLLGAIKTEPELRKIRDQGGVYSDLIETSLKLEGLNRHASTHAAGIVIGRESLTNYVPLYRDARSGAISTQYTGEDILQSCGLVKMDFLGLKTLTLIEETARLVSQSVEHGKSSFTISSIPENDSNTYEMLSSGRSTCVFQFESSGMKSLLTRSKPQRIQDLMALTSLYRPGPMQFIDQFIDAKAGRKPIVYPLKELEPILQETYGVIIYQEQVMKIAQIVAGYSLGQADILRRAMGKKKPKEMEEQRERFISGAINKNYSIKVAQKIFDLLAPFAEYGFPKPHAAAYSVLSYQTAYLKASYPAEFMAANLTNEINDTEKLAGYISETRDMGISVLPPSINLSTSVFSVSNGKIICGLKAIKNVGEAAVEEIVKRRKEGGKFVNIVDFLNRVDLKIVNRKVIEMLIKVGCFDSVQADTLEEFILSQQKGTKKIETNNDQDYNRATLFNNLDTLLNNVQAEKENRMYGQKNLFDSEEKLPINYPVNTLPEWSKRELLQNEKEGLGIFFSGHPIEEYANLIEKKGIIKINQLTNYATEGSKGSKAVVTIGLVGEIREIQTRSGNQMAFVTIEDQFSSVEMVVFSDPFSESRALLETGAVLAAKGIVDKSRGELKLIVETVNRPENIPDSKSSSFHIRVSSKTSEEQLMTLREHFISKSGDLQLYIHCALSDKEVIIKASHHIRVSENTEMIKEVTNLNYVQHAWME